MARKRSTENPSPNLSKEEDEESPAKKRVVINKYYSPSDTEDDDSKHTIPSPNVSDFTIRPLINNPSSKRPAPFGGSESMKKKKKEERTIDGKAPIIVLGLPRQQTATGKSASKRRGRSEGKSASKRRGRSEGKSASKRRGRSEVIVNRQQLELDKGKETMDGKSKKLLEEMLEMYIKRTELVKEQTRLLLGILKSEEN